MTRTLKARVTIEHVAVPLAPPRACWVVPPEVDEVEEGYAIAMAYGRTAVQYRTVVEVRDDDGHVDSYRGINSLGDEYNAPGLRFFISELDAWVDSIRIMWTDRQLRDWRLEQEKIAQRRAERSEVTA